MIKLAFKLNDHDQQEKMQKEKLRRVAKLLDESSQVYLYVRDGFVWRELFVIMIIAKRGSYLNDS